MRKSPNKLWALGPPLSLLLLAFAYYVKVPSFRDTVDTHFPWVKEHLAQFVPEPTVVMIKDPAKPVGTDSARPNARDASLATPAVGADKSKPKPKPPETHEEPLTMERFAASPALWPKKVKLRKTTGFPAMVNGKLMGKIQAPPGSEATLRQIKDQQLWVEFLGGGAWVPIAETDLLDQVKITTR